MQLSKKFEVSDNYKTYYLFGGSQYDPYRKNAIFLSDGTMITNYQFYPSAQGYKDNQMQGYVGYFLIDLNGTSRPNKWGRDIFEFFVGNNGIVYPNGSIAVAEVRDPNNINYYYWKTATDPSRTCNDDGRSYGWSCTARVLETGNMDYTDID